MAPAQLGLLQSIAAPPHELTAGTSPASPPPSVQVALLQPAAAPPKAPPKLQASLAPTNQLLALGPAAWLAPQQAPSPLAGEAAASAEQLSAAALAPGRLPAVLRSWLAPAQLPQLAPLPAPRLQPSPAATAAAGPQQLTAHLGSSGPMEMVAAGPEGASASCCNCPDPFSAGSPRLRLSSVICTARGAAISGSNRSGGSFWRQGLEGLASSGLVSAGLAIMVCLCHIGLWVRGWAACWWLESCAQLRLTHSKWHRKEGLPTGKQVVGSCFIAGVGGFVRGPLRFWMFAHAGSLRRCTGAS